MQPIKIDENIKQNLINEFTKYINNTKITNNNIYFSTTLPKTLDTTNIARPTLYISALAYAKMMLYVRDTHTEIAWHGTVERNTEKNYYYIKDVFLYPQKLAATTVQTDQTKYNNWLENLDDNTYNNLRFQGHSHVNMGTTPSGTDMQYYNDMLQVLPKNDFYIFAILNKSGDATFYIYDLAANLIYDTADINIKIITSQTQDLLKDINNDKEKYCEKPSYTYAYPTYTYPNTASKTYKDFLL
ncbi:MAG: hypothetical protein IJ272_07430, partial [Clostridia bacterium]|nr:hypothetical protein [Clostridia bacterium]